MVIEGGSITTIPTPYNDKIQCEEAAKDWDDSSYQQKHICIKAPLLTKNCTCSDGFTATPCNCSVSTHDENKDKGYVCQPGDNVCQTVK